MEGSAYQYTTESHVTAGPPEIGPQPGYIKSVPGFLKLVEIFLCLLTLICASIDYWSHLGGGWVQFVAASAMVTTAILFLFHFMNLLPRIPGPWILIEFLYYCIYCILIVTAAIVCAVRAHLTSAIGAATFFIFAALVVYGIDTYFQYQNYLTNKHTIRTTNTTEGATTTTTTTTTYETKTQY